MSPAFARAAAIARDQRKPIVALKTGRSEQGAKVAMSHTSSLAGADTLYDALFERYGIARMKSVSAFVETLKFLHHGGPIADSRLVSMSCSGGEAALVADMALEKKVSFPPFDAEHQARGGGDAQRICRHRQSARLPHLHLEPAGEAHRHLHRRCWGAALTSAMLILDVPTHPKMKPDTWMVTARALMNAAARPPRRAPPWSHACPKACRSIWRPSSRPWALLR